MKITCSGRVAGEEIRIISNLAQRIAWNRDTISCKNASYAGKCKIIFGIRYVSLILLGYVNLNIHTTPKTTLA